MPSINLQAQPRKFNKNRKGKRDERPPQDMPFDVALRKFKKQLKLQESYKMLDEKSFMKNLRLNVSVRRPRPKQELREKCACQQPFNLGGNSNVSNG